MEKIFTVFFNSKCRISRYQKKKIIVEEDYKGNTVKTGNSFII